MTVATELYRSIGRMAAKALAGAGATRSIAVRRSVATGEAVFPLSDIDLLVLVEDEVAASGAKLAKFNQRLRWVRLCTPRLQHVEVQSARGLRQMAKLDSYWASMERRTNLTLAGEPLSIEKTPLRRDDAVAKFGLWTEWFFPIALQLNSRRNIRKTALECWNAYATAEGMVMEPALRRSEMEASLRRTQPNIDVDKLSEPGCACHFVFWLAQRLHESRLPEFEALSEPLMFEATMAPLSMRRLLVVLPRADSPLPDSARARGAWPCTPELLHLYLEYKNPFLYWSLPEKLTQLGLEPPSREKFLEACRYYGHERFLTIPGFASPYLNSQGTRFNHIEHALAAIMTGRAPGPRSEGRIDEISSGAAVCLEYYRSSYDALRSRSLQLQDVAASISE
ncbi:MAG: hypothetical protein O3A53_15285 [Acidobacteria bacterium]|nr:hypothetical protein [Acidobacteriota bacterium]MDA1236150.1 hypothetical protein [Acidobacteriota bacterium]